MDIDATAQALATDEALPDQVDGGTDTSTDEDDGFDAAYDRIVAEANDETSEAKADEPAGEPEAGEDQEAGEAEQPLEENKAPDEASTETPADIPEDLRSQWSAMSKEAQDAVAKNYRAMSNRFSQQGRLIAGLKPIQDSMVGLAKEFPAMADMTPAQISQEMAALARINQAFNDNPVGAVMGLVKEHGLEGQLAAALQGVEPQTEQPADPSLQAEIRSLKQEISRLTDPNARRQEYQGWNEERAAGDAIAEFAATAKNWSDVESHMQPFVAIAQERMDPGTSHRDMLQSAYDMVVAALLPEVQAEVEVTTPPPDPVKAEAAVQAKQANVNGTKSGKKRPLTEDEEFDLAYDRAARR